MSALFGEKSVRRALNFAPLVDIIFLLLIFFMVTSSFQRHEAQPLAAVSAGAGDDVTVQLHVRRDGLFVLNDEMMDAARLQRALDARDFAEGITLSVETGVSVAELVAATDWLRKAQIAPLFFTKR